MTSSAMREKCAAIIEQADANSKNTSLSETASMLFWVRTALPLESVKPMISAEISRFMGRVVPAIAPEPNGDTFADSYTF